MRKLTRRMYKWIISTLVITLLLSTMPLSEIRADANTHGEYDCVPLAVVYNQTSTWGNNTQCEITVTNISDMKVEGWRLEFVFGSSVTINSIWNAQNLSNEDTPANSVDIGSEAHNANIEPSGSVSFGFIVSGLESAPVAPSEVCLVADDVAGDNPEAEITPTPIPEDTGMFPYAIFAGSMVTDLRFSGWKSDITGDIYSGKNFVCQGSELYVNGYARTVGTVQPAGWTTAMSGADENIAPLEMPDWGDKILAKADLMTTMEDDVFTSQNDIIADGFYYTEGSLSISSATFSGDVVIVANGDITLNVDTIINNGRILLYSETGNITVNGTQVELSGVVYAPNGRITLNAYDMTINGRVVADEFSYSGSILKIIADEADLQLFEELPEVTINASAQQVSVGDSAYFHITLPEETPYEINFRLNGEAVNINFSENETSGYYYLNTDQMGEYVFGAYVTLTYGEFSLGSSTILVSEVVTPTQEPTPTVTPTPVVTDIPEPTVTVTPTPTPTPVDEEQDSDSDGVPDVYEIEFGTDPYNPDTDGDGLYDFIELLIGYDPLSTDSDGNGILDGDEDLDSDGLTNANELLLGTSITFADTDGDGLSDGDELSVYFSDPLVIDTDGDGISDGDEILIGKNPSDATDGEYRVAQTTEQPIHNTEDSAITSVEVSVELANYIDSVLEINDMYNIDIYSTDVVGRLGSPIGFECQEEFDEALIVIHYDESALGETQEENLGVLWYDEESGFYIMQNQAVVDIEANTVTLELSHFSTYVLVDIDVWNSVKPIDYIIPTVDQNFDFYFALDLSRNMTLAARMEALSTLRTFISLMRSGDRICIMYFDTSYQVHGDPISIDDAEAIEEMMGIVEQNLKTASLGGNYGSYLIPFQVTEALINNYVEDIGNENALFILSNDTDIAFAGNYYNDMSYRMANANFAASFVMMGNKGEGDWQYGWRYAQVLGATYYSYANRVHFPGQFFASSAQTTGWDIDEDGDGLPDFMEQQGILLSNKKVIYTSTRCDELDSNGNPEGYDTDDDGLSDGAELGTMYTLQTNEVDGELVTSIFYPDDILIAIVPQKYDILGFFPDCVGTTYVFEYVSSPKHKDTDKDYYDDAEDPRPKIKDVLTLNLGGGSYDISKPDSGFIHVEKEYGGAQRSIYFVPTEIPDISGYFTLAYGLGQNDSNLDYWEPTQEHYRKQGCGLIAYTNLIAYFERGACTLTYEEYANYLNEAEKVLYVSGYGVPYIFIEAALENGGHCQSAQYKLFSTKEKFLEDYERMLSNNNPIIMSNLSALQEENPEAGLVYYSATCDPGDEYLYGDSMRIGSLEFYADINNDVNGHYYDVTGIVYDNVTDMVYFRISSWGEEYYICLDEYIETLDIPIIDKITSGYISVK